MPRASTKAVGAANASAPCPTPPLVSAAEESTARILTIARLAEEFTVLHQLEEQYGSAHAAIQRLNHLEHAQKELMDTISLLKRKLKNTQLNAERARFDADSFVKYIWRNFACRGDMGQLVQLIKHFQEHDGRPPAAYHDGNLLLSVQEIADAPVVNAVAKPAAAQAGTEDGENVAAAMDAVKSPKKIPTKPKRARSMSPAHAKANRADGRSKKQRTHADRGGNEEVVVVQNLNVPNERRNVTEMKHSSQFVNFDVLEEIERAKPWENMYRHRPRVSHVVSYYDLDQVAQVWLKDVLQVQYTYRREMWERLHWLPMSETVLPGQKWDKARQTRKKRAAVAVNAWRRVYNESIALIRTGKLPPDVWCDPALWYMPGSPYYWFPQEHGFWARYEQIDQEQPVRVYYVNDISKHPFYVDGLVNKYPHQFILPRLDEHGEEVHECPDGSSEVNGMRSLAIPANGLSSTSQEDSARNAEENARDASLLASMATAPVREEPMPASKSDGGEVPTLDESTTADSCPDAASTTAETTTKEVQTRSRGMNEATQRQVSEKSSSAQS